MAKERSRLARDLQRKVDTLQAENAGLRRELGDTKQHRDNAQRQWDETIRRSTDKLRLVSDLEQSLTANITPLIRKAHKLGLVVQLGFGTTPQGEVVALATVLELVR